MTISTQVFYGVLKPLFKCDAAKHRFAAVTFSRGISGGKNVKNRQRWVLIVIAGFHARRVSSSIAM